MHFTSNGVGTNNVLLSTGNYYASFVIAGHWDDFESHGDFLTSMSDTATGNVAIGTAYQQTWTPTLQFCSSPGTGCTSTGVTYSGRTGAITAPPSTAKTSLVRSVTRMVLTTSMLLPMSASD